MPTYSFSIGASLVVGFGETTPVSTARPEPSWGAEAHSFMPSLMGLGQFPGGTKSAGADESKAAEWEALEKLLADSSATYSEVPHQIQ